VGRSARHGSVILSANVCANARSGGRCSHTANGQTFPHCLRHRGVIDNDLATARQRLSVILFQDCDLIRNTLSQINKVTQHQASEYMDGKPSRYNQPPRSAQPSAFPEMVQ